MTDALDQDALDYYRKHVVEFIETFLVNPETGDAYRLYPAEKLFIAHMFETDEDGHLVHSDLIYSCGKKGGKTEFGALLLLITILLFGGPNAEGYAIANDLEQAQSRVYERCRRIIAASPLLQREAKVSNDRILFTATNATITALSSDYASAAGGHPTIAVYDEIWGFFTERGRRLWDELVPVPTRKISCRLIVSHAGFEGESQLLYELYQFGLKQKEIAPCLYSGDGQLMFWTHEPISPLQTEKWRENMRRKLRPNQYLRMIENRFTSSEAAFISMDKWDRCVDDNIGQLPSAPFLPVYIGVDASMKHDQTAIVVTAIQSDVVRLVYHRVFQPSPEEPLNFEQTIEATLLELSRKYLVKKIIFDPFQMQSTAQRLLQQGLPIEEFPQTVPNLTAASQNLFDLIESQSIVMYPDPTMRLAVSRCVAVESSRGWKIAKEKGSHKIDVIVALAMACHAAVKSQSEPFFDRSWNWVSGPDNDEATRKEQERKDADAFTRARLHAHLAAHGAFGGFPFR